MHHPDAEARGTSSFSKKSDQCKLRKKFYYTCSNIMQMKLKTTFLILCEYLFYQFTLQVKWTSINTPIVPVLFVSTCEIWHALCLHNSSKKIVAHGKAPTFPCYLISICESLHIMSIQHNKNILKARGNARAFY